VPHLCRSTSPVFACQDSISLPKPLLSAPPVPFVANHLPPQPCSTNSPPPYDPTWEPPCSAGAGPTTSHYLGVALAPHSFL